MSILPSTPVPMPSFRTTHHLVAASTRSSNSIWGKPYTLSEIVYTDRVTSGGANNAWRGGLFDYVFALSYILSVDDDFTNGDGKSDDIIFEVEAEEPHWARFPMNQRLRRCRPQV